VRSGRAIRVAVVDDHPVVRDGTAALLARQEGIEVSGTAASVDEARELLARGGTDVVLLDMRLGTDTGLRLLTEPRGELGSGAAPGSVPASARGSAAGSASPSSALVPGPAIVVLTAYDYPQYAEAALRLGAAGFVPKTAPLPELLDAIHRAAAGGLAYSVRPHSPLPRLSPRELDVVRLVVDGHTNDEAGRLLGIGVKTVETHLRRIFERFGIVSRTELVARALKEGWLDIPSVSSDG
jgi:DNA-binding NarL/FixJ family response regulator